MQFMEFAHHTLAFLLLHCVLCSLFITHTHVCSLLSSTLRQLLLHVVYVSDKRGLVEPTPRDQSPQSAHLSPGKPSPWRTCHNANLLLRQKPVTMVKLSLLGPHPWLIHYIITFRASLCHAWIWNHLYACVSENIDLAESSCSGYIQYVSRGLSCYWFIYLVFRFLNVSVCFCSLFNLFKSGFPCGFWQYNIIKNIFIFQSYGDI